MRIKIMPTRHSPFYSPFLACQAMGFLEREGIEAELRLPSPGESAGTLLRRGEIDVSQSAVSATWTLLDKGETEVPIHFAQINQRDGFCLLGRELDPEFTWKHLEGRSIVADQGKQPMAMLRWAAHHKGTDWSKVRVIHAGSPEAMEAAFRKGEGDFLHLQAGVPQQMEIDGAGFVVARVGEGVKELAFSSISAYPPFLESDRVTPFMRAFAKAKVWAHESSAGEVTEGLIPLFPGLSEAALATAIRDCQILGCWAGGVEIPREMYEEAQRAFLWASEIRNLYPYETVCATPKL